MALLGAAKAADAQQAMPHHGMPIPPDRLAPLRGEGPVVMTPAQYAQRFVDSPAPAGAPGRWVNRTPLPLPLPLPRSGHGLVLYRGRFFAMGGESGWFEGRVLTGRVHGQMESHDPAADTWQHHAPMPTPRHGMGAVAIGDFIYVAGGGPVAGGGIKSAVHEAFTLD